MKISIEKSLYILHLIQTISHSKYLNKLVISPKIYNDLRIYLSKIKLLVSLAVPTLIYTALRSKVGLKTSLFISAIPNLITSIIFIFNYVK